MLGLSLNYFLLALKPLVILSIPGLFLLAQLNLYYGNRPLKVGERALIEVAVPSGSKATGLTLLAPPQLEIEAAVRSDTLNQATWRIRGVEEGHHELTIRNLDSSISETKAIYVGAYVGPVTSQIVNTWWGALLYPVHELGTSSINSLVSLSINYPEKSMMFLGMHMHWILVFVIVSLASGLVGARIFSVEI